jgi:hypothetical protein
MASWPRLVWLPYTVKASVEAVPTRGIRYPHDQEDTSGVVVRWLTHDVSHEPIKGGDPTPSSQDPNFTPPAQRGRDSGVESTLRLTLYP